MNADGNAISPSSVISADLSAQSPDPLAAALTQAPFIIAHSPSPRLAYPSTSSSSTENAPNSSFPDDGHGIAESRNVDTVLVKLEPGLSDSAVREPDTLLESGEPVVASDETQEWMPEGDHELKRVKVCSFTLHPYLSIFLLVLFGASDDLFHSCSESLPCAIYAFSLDECPPPRPSFRLICALGQTDALKR
jgi:hypothetical protein